MAGKVLRHFGFLIWIFLIIRADSICGQSDGEPVSLSLNHSPSIFFSDSSYYFALTLNPASLLFNGSLSWQQIQSSFDYFHNGFRRTFDPRSREMGRASIGEYRWLDANSIIRWKFTAFQDNLNDVPFALERKPYEDNPFILADSSSGSMGFWGPELMVDYCRLVKPSLRFGTGFRYTIDSAVRDRGVQAKIVERNVDAHFGVELLLSRRITTGFLYRYQNYYTITNIPNYLDGSVPITYRYRGYTVFRPEFRKFDRNKVLASHTMLHHGRLTLSQSVSAIYKLQYTLRFTDIYDGRSIRIDEAYWQESTIHSDVRAILRRAQTGRWLIIFGRGWIRHDWSRHAQFPVKITEQHRREAEFGARLTSPIFNATWILKQEMAITTENREFKDYIGHRGYDIVRNGITVSSSAELAVSPSFRFILGLTFTRVNQNAPAPFLIGPFTRWQVHLGCRWIKRGVVWQPLMVYSYSRSDWYIKEKIQYISFRIKFFRKLP